MIARSVIGVICGVVILVPGVLLVSPVSPRSADASSRAAVGAGADLGTPLSEAARYRVSVSPPAWSPDGRKIA